MIIETAFTPWQSLGGGLLIGLASVLLMATMGRIMGATGVLAGVLQPSSRDDWAWRAAIVLGMITGPLIVMRLRDRAPVATVHHRHGHLHDFHRDHRLCDPPCCGGLSDAFDHLLFYWPDLWRWHFHFRYGEPGEGHELL